MKNFVEALILYYILFYSWFAAPGFSPEVASSVSFSIYWALNRTITYTIPALALIWYIVLGKKTLSDFIQLKPRQKDLIPIGIGFLGLVSIGLVISFAISLLSRYFGIAIPPKIEAPNGITAWIVMVVLCLGTGYLEESYFRYYLLTKLEIFNLPGKVILSSMLFALCHIYDGPFGITNALLAGILLSLLFIRYRSLHGIALAHGFYNIFVYTMGIFL